VTNTGVDTARPPLGLAMSSLLRADTIVLLNSKTSIGLSMLLPVVILVATTFGKAQTRLGGSSLIIGLALTLGLIASVVVVIVGAIVHGLTLNAGQYALVLGVAVLGVAVLGAAMFLAIGQALVGLVQSTSAINAISRLLMIVLILLGLLGGTGILGDTMKTIADWSPVGALMTLFSDG
jgi:ABC-2 type transport system permease protein